MVQSITPRLCTCIHTYMNTYTCTHVSTHTHINLHIYLHTCITPPPPTPTHPPTHTSIQIFLVVVTLVKWIQLPTKISLPVAAVFMWCIRLMYFAAPPNYVTALVVSGFFEALTPLSIIFGAILLFQVCEQWAYD